jgi:hypothetical protein
MKGSNSSITLSVDVTTAKMIFPFLAHSGILNIFTKNFPGEYIY